MNVQKKKLYELVKKIMHLTLEDVIEWKINNTVINLSIQQEIYYAKNIESVHILSTPNNLYIYESLKMIEHISHNISSYESNYPLLNLHSSNKCVIASRNDSDFADIIDELYWHIIGKKIDNSFKPLYIAANKTGHKLTEIGEKLKQPPKNKRGRKSGSQWIIF